MSQKAVLPKSRSLLKSWYDHSDIFNKCESTVKRQQHVMLCTCSSVSANALEISPLQSPKCTVWYDVDCTLIDENKKCLYLKNGLLNYVIVT
jgi:hypothetical protein